MSRRKPGVAVVGGSSQQQQDLDFKDHPPPPNAAQFRGTVLLSRITFIGLILMVIWVGLISSLHWERMQHKALNEQQQQQQQQPVVEGGVWPFTLTGEVGEFVRYPKQGGIAECAGAQNYQLCCKRDGTLICAYGRGSTQKNTLECTMHMTETDVFVRVYAGHPSMRGAACKLFCFT